MKLRGRDIDFDVYSIVSMVELEILMEYFFILNIKLKNRLNCCYSYWDKWLLVFDVCFVVDEFFIEVGYLL